MNALVTFQAPKKLVSMCSRIASIGVSASPAIVATAALLISRFASFAASAAARASAGFSHVELDRADARAIEPRPTDCSSDGRSRAVA